MKALLAISSCQEYESKGYNQSSRDTWIPALAEAGLDYRFFHGCGSEVKPDVIVLDCPDDYGSLCYKTHASQKWALDQGYEYLFRCWPDTYVVPERLARSGFERFDYAGNFEGGSMTAAGGPGYWLSRKALELMMLHEVSPTHPNIGAIFEDRWVGTIMNRFRAEIKQSDDRRYAEGAWLWGNTPLKSNELITAHLWGGEGKTNPETFSRTMFETHRKWQNS